MTTFISNPEQVIRRIGPIRPIRPIGRLTPPERAGCPSRQTSARGGFTLLELLVVMGVISLLLGMLLTAIRAVTQHTRRTIARAEVRMLEGAWKQYFTHYQRWPSNEVFQQVFTITADIAKGLEGRVHDLPPDLQGFNPEGIAFMEFTRYRHDATPAPINPSQSTIHIPPEHLPELQNSSDLLTSDLKPDGRQFLCLLDLDDVGQLNLPTPLPGSQHPDQTSVARDVIVWTYDERFSRNPRAQYIIGSWQQ